ncbi:MAG: FAD/NAD(P)-binding protein, partial [Myxococcota bacterium]
MTSTTLDWLIIGGGIHGVHIAARLIHEGEVPPDQLRLVDPAERLLDRWRTCTATTGMTHLRSPSVHNLDITPRSLDRFARERRSREPDIFVPPYDRPSLDLFNAHCDHVVKTFGLADLHVQARAVTCDIDSDGVTVALSGGEELHAHKVVLAMGASEQPFWPDWAPHDHPHVHHVFQPGFEGWPATDGCEAVAVVGGGISACQVALRLHREGHQVHLLSRGALREHQFDSEPGWLGPKHMAGFSRIQELDRRRAVIHQA